MANDYMWTFAGKACSHPGVLADSITGYALNDDLPIWQRANSYECRDGAEPGNGWVVMPRKSAKSINQDSIHTLEITGNYGTVSLAGMVVTNMESMFGLAGDDDSPVLVSFQDRRNIAKRSSINKGYNIHVAAPVDGAKLKNRYYPESLNGEKKWTWQELCEDIWGMLSDMGDCPEFDDEPEHPPIDLRFFGMRAWDSLHAALSIIGYTTGYDPVADEFVFKRPEADSEIDIPAARLMQDFDPLQDGNAGTSPEKIDVYFHKRAKYHGTELDTPHTKNWEADPVHKITVDGVSGGKGTLAVTADIFALIGFDGNITQESLTFMQSRAAQIAESVQKSVDLERFQVLSSAASEFTPRSPAISKVTWRDYGDDAGQITIIECGIESIDGNGGERSPEYDSIKPGDYGRRSHPVYPRLSQFVQVVDDQQETGELIKPIQGQIGSKPAYLHRGLVRLFRDGLETLDECWIVVVDEFDTNNGEIELINGHGYAGRLCGTASAGNVEKPLYGIARGEASVSGAIAFTMLCDRTREQINGLSIGYSQAEITGIVGDVPHKVGNTIQVVFPDKRWLESVKGCQGWALYIPSPLESSSSDSSADGSYIVVECQGLVQGFWFKTLEDRGGYAQQDVQVQVVLNIGHANDDLPRELWSQTTPVPPPPTSEPIATATTDCSGNPNSPGQQIVKVRYLAGTFPRMLSGAIGYASLNNDIENQTDNSTMVYVVEQSDQMATRIKAALTDKMCGSSAAIATFTIMDFYPFGQLPTNVGQSIPNPLSHYGKSGDTIKAEWNETVERWEVYDVTKHVVINSAISTSTVNGCTTILNTKTPIAVELCDDGKSETLLAYRTQTVSNVTNLRLDKGQTGSGSGIQCTPKLAIDHTEYEGLVLCGDPVPDTEEFNLELQPVVWDMDMDGCPTWQNSVAIVIGVCGDDTDGEADCEPCPTEGSGSGS